MVKLISFNGFSGVFGLRNIGVDQSENLFIGNANSEMAISGKYVYRVFENVFGTFGTAILGNEQVIFILPVYHLFCELTWEQSNIRLFVAFHFIQSIKLLEIH